MLAIVGSVLFSSLLQIGVAHEPEAPGDGVGLAPNPIQRTTTALADEHGATPESGPDTPFRTPPGIVAGAGLAALGAGYRRREDPLVVVVHGDGGSPGDFDYLVASLGLPPDRVVAFDYSSGFGTRASTEASQVVATSDAAQALDRLLRSLSEENANIYTIHHSRGGAVGVEMIADLDAGVRPPIDGYRGAALLDPAIAAGGLGAVQSLGAGSSEIARLIPDDGGFDPIRCDEECHDVREHLGEASGVSVVAIRNPDAELTNFDDEPSGLRVFDLADSKASAWVYWVVSPILGWHRMTEAHGSVLTSDVVAECVAAEIAEPGSCRSLSGQSSRFGFSSAGRNRAM
jgi:hypothetical protein